MRHSHEPMLAQLRLAWWREQLGADPATRPRGEPLLAALGSWEGHEAGLAALADGWEQLTGAAPLPEAALDAFAQGRAAAFAALARAIGSADDPAVVTALARRWALADLAGRVSHPAERAAALALVEAQLVPRARLSRAMRPLAVLHGLALRGGNPGGVGALFATLRLGLLGR